LLEEGFSSTDIASALLHHLQGGESASGAKVRREEAGRQRYEPRANPVHEGRYASHDERPRRNHDEPAHRRERSAGPRRQEIAGPAPVKASPVPAKSLPQEATPLTPAAPRVAQPAPPHRPKASRQTTDAQTLLHLNLGAEMGVSETDIVATILGETGLPRSVVGPVDMRERHLFVYVASEHANSIISKLNRAQIKGRKAKAKVA
jgi:ATP-dependent RNA helicase DeaD